MIEITVPAQHHEFFDEETETFLRVDIDHDTTLQLEHSLIALRKWEQKTHKPFIKAEDKTIEESIEYIKCMTLNKVRNPIVYQFIPEEELKRVKEYIDDPMTATWFKNKEGGPMGSSSRETITAEIIYYWMFRLNIPLELEKWHLNQLITMIRVASIKDKESSNPKGKRVNKRDAARERAALNAKRRAQYHSNG